MGARLTTITTNFQSGELDPTLRGQKDLDAYKNGAKQLRNVWWRATGGVERRPGTYDLAGLAAKTRAETFEFSADQRYFVGFSDARVDLRDVDGNILQSIAGCPWDASTVWEMSTTQDGDTMILCHPSFKTQELVRTGASSFALQDFVFDKSPDNKRIYQPYYKFEAAEVTLTPSVATGSGTLTAKDASGNPVSIFLAGHVGLRFRIYDAEVTIDSLVSGSVANMTVLGTLEGTLDLDPYKTAKGSVVVEVLHLFHGLITGATITLSGSNTCGSIPGSYFDGAHTVTVLDEHRYTITLAGVSYNYWEDTNGDGTPESTAYVVARISEDGGGPNIKFSCAGTATRAWLEPSFSSVRGYAAACSFHEGRLWLGGSTSQPDGAWGSNALFPRKFDSGKGYDGDSVQVATGTEDSSQTRHLISCGALMVMNANTEEAFIVRDGEAITPNNARVKRQSGAGCSNVQPCVFDSAVLFTQENGLSAYELAMDRSIGDYAAVPVSVLAGHLIRSPTSIAASAGTANRAEQSCFFTNADGTVALFHSLRRENIAGWALWTLGGCTVDSVATVGPYIYFAVTRTSDGAFRLYRLSDLDLVSLDGAVAHDSVSATVNWVLDARVRSRTLHLVSELGYHGTYDVPASGVVTLTVPVTKLVAGDSFLGLVEPLPPSVNMPSGPTDGEIKRTVRSIVDFGDDSLAATVEGCPIATFTADLDPAAAVRPVTSPYEMHHLGCDRDPTLTLSQSAPLAPWRVLSVLQEVLV